MARIVEIDINTSAGKLIEKLKNTKAIIDEAAKGFAAISDATIGATISFEKATIDLTSALGDFKDIESYDHFVRGRYATLPHAEMAWLLEDEPGFPINYWQIENDVIIINSMYDILPRKE